MALSQAEGVNPCRALYAFSLLWFDPLSIPLFLSPGGCFDLDFALFSTSS